MAINPNETLLNEHCSFLGGSGSGKTFKVKQKINANKKASVLLFDAEQVYTDEVQYFDNFFEFAKAVIRADDKGKVYRYGYSGNQSDFNKFCELVWLVANGNKPLICIFEECGGYLGNGASTDDWWYKLISIGRKYNIQVLPVSQRPQNMSKVLFDNCNKKWLGYSMGKAKNYLESEYKIDMDKIKAESYDYYFVDSKGVKLFGKNDKPKPSQRKSKTK